MPMPTPTQKLAVFMAFLAAALSLAAVLTAYIRTGQVRVTPLAGAVVMLALGISGYKRLKAPPA
jgi:hypothetical protein